MNQKIGLGLLLLLFLQCFIIFPFPAILNPFLEEEPEYFGIAKYYDNRTCVVTSSHDDFAYNTTVWRNCLTMFTEKGLYHTVAIITNRTDWDWAQYWINQGYTEAASHSRNHVHVPYTGTDPYNGRPRVSYEWQINGSKNDIIGNLSLPRWWRYKDKEYVYTWIEPYGSCDATVRQWLGDCYYLCDRSIASSVYDFASWDSQNELFNRVGYTVEMGSPPWGGDSSLTSLNRKFDYAYNNSKIYHLITHPSHVDWSEGSYADLHTTYISGRKDVWYVPLGPLYLYHWVQTRNITKVATVYSGLGKIFKISVNETDHENYGLSYPITYVFSIPSSWTSGCVYYRFRESDPWIAMLEKSSEDYFNGITACRFDFENDKVFVSVGFGDVSHEIYLKIGSPISVPEDFLTIQAAINSAPVGSIIHVQKGNYYGPISIIKSVWLIGEDRNATIIDGNNAGSVVYVISNDCVISNFTFRNGGIEELDSGVYVKNSNNVNVHFNIVVNNTNGVLLENSSNSTISGNDIYLNTQCGMLLKNSSGNKIFHNNFFNNNLQVLSQNSSNVWNDCYPFGGNYWSDHNSSDIYKGVWQNESGSDGIGDEVYRILDDEDMYPLMKPWPSHDIAVIDITAPKSIIQTGEFVNVDVTIINQGDFEESLNLTLYANDTAIETKSIVGLPLRTSTIVTYKWNASKFPSGNYVISAYAWPVPYEKEDEDNLYIDGTVSIVAPFCNIAIVSITFSKLDPTVGETVHIYVTVENQGNIPATFDLGLNYTRIIDPLIGSQRVTLDAGSFIIVDFTWEPADDGSFQIKAYIHNISNDANPSDNTKIMYIYVFQN